MFYKDDKFDAVLGALIKPLEEIVQRTLSRVEKISNKLTEFSESATDEQYYSAKATNEIFNAVGEVFEIINKENKETFATKTELEALKSELQGDIDEISDLVGGEGSKVETEPIIPYGIYTFVADTDSPGLSYYMLNDNVPYFQEAFKDGDKFNLTFGEDTYTNISVKQEAGMSYIGNMDIFGAYDGTNENCCIVTLNDSGGLIIYTTLPANNYTLSLERIIGGAE